MRCCQGGGRVLAGVDAVAGHPAGEDDCDEHEGVVTLEMEIDEVRRVVGAVPRQIYLLAADVQVRWSVRSSPPAPARPLQVVADGPGASRPDQS
jgi:hypothetical protein